jgi:hypothetical protein
MTQNIQNHKEAEQARNESATAVKTNELAAKIQKNLELMKQARDSEATGEFFKMQSGQKTVLQFTGDFEAVLREFQEKDASGNVVKDASGNVKMVKKLRYEYRILDINNQDRGVMTWAVSKNVSKTIDEFLAEGFLTLKVSRGSRYGHEVLLRTCQWKR